LDLPAASAVRRRHPGSARCSWRRGSATARRSLPRHLASEVCSRPRLLPAWRVCLLLRPGGCACCSGLAGLLAACGAAKRTHARRLRACGVPLPATSPPLAVSRLCARRRGSRRPPRALREWRLHPPLAAKPLAAAWRLHLLPSTGRPLLESRLPRALPRGRPLSASRDAPAAPRSVAVGVVASSSLAGRPLLAGRSMLAALRIGPCLAVGRSRRRCGSSMPRGWAAVRGVAARPRCLAMGRSVDAAPRPHMLAV
jgi:hypothetical protein